MEHYIFQLNKFKILKELKFSLKMILKLLLILLKKANLLIFQYLLFQKHTFQFSKNQKLLLLKTMLINMQLKLMTRFIHQSLMEVIDKLSLIKQLTFQFKERNLKLENQLLFQMYQNNFILSLLIKSHIFQFKPSQKSMYLYSK